MEIRTSPLVQMAGEAQRPTRWWLSWAAAAVMIIVGALIGDAVGSVVLGDPERTDTLDQFKDFFTFGCSLLFLFLWVRLKERRGFSSVGFRGARAVPKLLVGFAIGAAMMALAVAIPLVTGDLTDGGSTHTNTGASALLPLLALVLIFYWQASTEESITRGYMLQTTGRQTGAWFAVLGTSIFFAVMHVTTDPVALLNTALYAAFASFVALGQGNLWLICGIHAGWNYVQGNIFGVPVSGHPLANSLLDFGPASGASDLLTGGKYGLEASLSGTIVLIAGLAVAYVLYRRREAARATEPQEAPPAERERVTAA